MVCTCGKFSWVFMGCPYLHIISSLVNGGLGTRLMSTNANGITEDRAFKRNEHIYNNC